MKDDHCTLKREADMDAIKGVIAKHVASSNDAHAEAARVRLIEMQRETVTTLMSMSKTLAADILEWLDTKG